jgi:hypothetical protein
MTLLASFEMRMRFPSVDPAAGDDRADPDEVKSGQRDAVGVEFRVERVARVGSKEVMVVGESSSAGNTLPFGRAFWVESPHLLAGCYPGDLDPATSREKLLGLLRCGVTDVISLMEPDEVNYGGVAFRDYAAELTTLAQECGRNVCYARFPIRDLSVPGVAHMREILDAIDAAIRAGSCVYVHCWGGRGRTGTVVGCWLVRHRRVAADAVLARLRILTSGHPAFGRVPETEAQRCCVENWPPGA